MAVYTPLDQNAIAQHLAGYELGLLTRWHGITEGVENSNFLIETTTGRYILTLFEKRVRESDLPYYLGYMAHLAARGIHCPKPVADKTGALLSKVKGKPAVILTFMQGEGVREITDAHMPLLGKLTADMHLAAKDFTLKRANDLAFDGWQKLAEKIGQRAEKVIPGLATLIDEELHYLQGAWPAKLPSGAVHADLFPDNVFFTQRGEGKPKFTGVIDFYFACNESFAYDLSICFNAWCFSEQSALVKTRAKGLMEAYQGVRHLTRQEVEAFPVLARGSALRFLLTRTHDLVFHPPEALVTPKDPKEYLAKLLWHRKTKAADYAL